MSSHRTTSDYFNHRALRIRPRPPLWLARVAGYLKHNHRQHRIVLSKSKNPARCSVVLALGESNSKAIEANQKTRLPYDKTTQYPAGFRSASSPRCHSRRFRLYAQSFMACQLLFFLSTIWGRVCTVHLRAFPSENP